MELNGRPLLDTKLDHELFAGREDELTRLVAAVERGLNVLLIGERGSGKTTLLRQLAYVLRQTRPNDPPPAFVQGNLAADARSFLGLVRHRLGLPPPAPDRNAWGDPGGTGGANAQVSEPLDLAGLVASLREAAPSTRRVIMVDELSPTIGQTVFGRLRDELWQLPFTWVVAATEEEAGPYLSPPANAFFDLVLRLSPLSTEGQQDLLEKRAGRRGRRIASQLNEGNPRRLLALAREALQGGATASELRDARNRRDERVARLGRAAEMLMAELEALGPVSASDQNLLRRLGWTRSRAVQVFRQLEDEGLVTSSTVKGESGRPRKVYRPAEVGKDAV